MKKKTKKEAALIKSNFIMPRGIDAEVADDQAEVFEFLGRHGYETVFLNSVLTKGAFLLKVKVLELGEDACVRVGAVCIEEAELGAREVFCLGSGKSSYALRSKDYTLIENGKVKFRPSLPKVIQGDVETLKQAIETPKDDQTCLESEKMEPETPENNDIHLVNGPLNIKENEEDLPLIPSQPELGDSLYCLLSIKNPKLMKLVLKYKDTIPENELFYNMENSLTFFSEKYEILGSFRNIREGGYQVGFSLYKDAKVQIQKVNSYQEISKILKNLKNFEEKKEDLSILKDQGLQPNKIIHNFIPCLEENDWILQFQDEKIEKSYLGKRRDPEKLTRQQFCKFLFDNSSSKDIKREINIKYNIITRILNIKYNNISQESDQGVKQWLDVFQVSIKNKGVNNSSNSRVELLRDPLLLDSDYGASCSVQLLQFPQKSWTCCKSGLPSKQGVGVLGGTPYPYILTWGGRFPAIYLEYLGCTRP